MSFTPSKIQQEIIDHKEGAMLVEATAGTGKTYVLTERIRKLVSNSNENFGVLALTFTNKAADEMKKRLSNNKRVFVSNIHSFCFEIFRERKRFVGYSEMPHIIESDNDKVELLEQIFNTNLELKPYFFDREAKEKKDLLQNSLKFIKTQKQNLKFSTIILNSDSLTEKQKILIKEYDDILKSQNLIDYDDILIKAYEIFDKYPDIAKLYRNIYKYICIDEAQDLNFAQYQIIKTLCGSDYKNVFMVGDPNQAIYAFGGADKKYFLENFVSDFNPKRIVLKDNYRSSQKVILAANTLNPNSISIENVPIVGEFVLIGLKNEEEEANWIVAKIEELLKKGHKDISEKISFDKIAVLGRNKFVFNALTFAFRNAKYKFHLKKTNDSIESVSDFMKIFELCIRVHTNPKDEIHFYQILRLLNLDIDLTTNNITSLDKLITIQNRITDIYEKTKFEIIVKAIQNIGTENKPMFLNALEVLKTYTLGNFKTKDEENEKENVLKDIAEWTNLWNVYLLKSSSDNRSLSHFKQMVALGELNEIGNMNEGITLSTVHSAKGLQFDIVFLIGMTEGVFPDYRSLNNQNELNEEKNNAFVALTRAKRLLYVTYPIEKMMPWGKPKKEMISRFIENMDKIK